MNIFNDNVPLDGGGFGVAKQFSNTVRTKIGHVHACMEMFCGHGFIGFTLLEQGLCDELILVDVRPEAIEYVNKTINHSKLKGKVRAYQSDCFDNIPPVEVDLIIGNPPHFWTFTEELYEKDPRTYDPNMRIHQKFYKQAKQFLTPCGQILLLENYRATKQEDFKQMIKNGGLTFVGWWRDRRFSVERLLTFKNPWYNAKNYFILVRS